MADRDTSISRTFNCPPQVAGLRPLKAEEIDRLAAALGKPIDRNYLAFWVSQSIANAVTFSTLPSARICRDELMRVAREGRQCLRRIEECPGQMLQQGIKIDELKASVARFCVHAEAVAKEVGGLIKRGQRPTSPALQAFLDGMIGIAKRAKVRPSTPQRYMNIERPPAFFAFVEEALAIAEEVLIDSSRLAERQQASALASLRIYSRDALIKLLERSRGRIGSYHESAFGLVEDSSSAPATRQRRSRA